jgi:hypothetical protein
MIFVVGKTTLKASGMKYNRHLCNHLFNVPVYLKVLEFCLTLTISSIFINDYTFSQGLKMLISFYIVPFQLQVASGF